MRWRGHLQLSAYAITWDWSEENRLKVNLCYFEDLSKSSYKIKRCESIHRIKFRKGERAWFTCENEDALIEDKASEFFKLNFVYIEVIMIKHDILIDGSALSILHSRKIVVWPFQCPGTNGRKFNESLYDNTTNVWPKCELQKTCPLDSLPAPDSASGLQLQQRKGNILVGEHAIYECMRRSEFFEMNIVSIQ